MRFIRPGASDGIRAGRRTIPDEARAAYVRAMFDAIAPRYDLTNTVISAGLHRRWKRRTVALLRPRKGEHALDLCCGTGDLAGELAAAVGPDGRVVGMDFAPAMIALARRRFGRRPPTHSPCEFLLADALHLPFAGASFDAATMGFGLRNVADPRSALQEIRRVLRPGGRLALLEFAAVPNRLIRALYDLYSFTLLAALGRLVSGHRDAYLYLPVSVRHWADQAQVVALLKEAGFSGATAANLGQGVVAVYLAEARGP